MKKNGSSLFWQILSPNLKNEHEEFAREMEIRLEAAYRRKKREEIANMMQGHEAFKKRMAERRERDRLHREKED